MSAPDIAFFVGWLRSLRAVEDTWRAVVVEEAIETLAAHIDAWVPELCRRAGNNTYARRREVQEAAVAGVTDLLIAAGEGRDYPSDRGWYSAAYEAAAESVTRRLGVRAAALTAILECCRAQGGRKTTALGQEAP